MCIQARLPSRCSVRSASPSNFIFESCVEKYTLCAIFTGSAPHFTNSCAKAKVRSVVPVKQNEPVSVSTAVYRQVATSGETFTPASRARRKIISAVAQALGSIQLTSPNGRAVSW